MDDTPEAPPPPGPTKVEITVGGHTIIIESAEPLADVVGYAYELHQRTSDAAKKIPMGFDVGGGQFERAEPYVEPSSMQSWEDERARPVGRLESQDGTTKRLVVDHPPGDHRARLRPVQVDRGRAAVPRTRH
jgi:hypothetical protein